MSVEIYADGASIVDMQRLAANPDIRGFTTNPSLLRKSGVGHYANFARRALEIAGDRPVSFEVLADDGPEVMRQALAIASWGPTAHVKVPVTNSQGRSLTPLIAALAHQGVPVNVTAVFTMAQVFEVNVALRGARGPATISIFAGRIADAGYDPVRTVGPMARTVHAGAPGTKVLWASPRQVYDATLAARAGCDIITMSPELIDKLALRGKDLSEFSRETVEMFYRDAQASGLTL